MYGRLFMARQYVLDRRPHQIIVNINDRTTRVAKNSINAFLNQALQKNFRTSQFHFLYSSNEPSEAARIINLEFQNPN
jgi:hypothetical protein